MKATGIVRTVDALGRFVLPKELRDMLGIAIGDKLEVYVEGERVILKKYAPGCIFCADPENVTYFDGHPICPACLEKLKKL